MSVTNIERLIRDPYAIYGAKILRLRALNPIQHAPNAIDRGILIHEVFHKFVSISAKQPEDLSTDALLNVASTVLRDNVPWPTERIQWRVRIEKIAKWFVAQETLRQLSARPTLFERTGAVDLASPPFRVTAKADRIDIDGNGNAQVYDYKTGSAPSKDQQLNFDVQLLVIAALISEGGFAELASHHVSDARYISLGGEGKEVPAPLEDCPPERTLAMLIKLIDAYRDPNQGYTARNKMHKDVYGSDYDQLSRFGEWDVSDTAQKVFLT